MIEAENNKTKDREAVCTYIQILQDVITRMGTNSSNIKALIAVIYTIFVTVIITVNQLKKYWWIGLIIAFIGIMMDTSYLAFERMYRKKYNIFLKSINENRVEEEIIFDMNPKNTDLKFELFAEMLECCKSFSVWGFYILFIIITIVLKIM